MLTILFLFCLCTVVTSRECQNIQSRIILPCKGDEIIYDEYCGSDNEFAGQGGIDAEEDGFSHLAPLTYDKVFNESEFGCESSVISEKFVLTAAHCSTTSARVAVSCAESGFLQHKDMYDIPEKNVQGVQKIIKHPVYKHPSIYHDIALLDLDKEMVISVIIRLSCPQLADTMYDRAYVTGWGAVEHRSINANVLQSGDSGGAFNIRNRIKEKKKKWTSLVASWYPKDREGQNRTVEDNFGTLISSTWTRTGRNRTESDLVEDNFVGEQVEEYSRSSFFTVLDFVVSVFAS